jgi:hypothetical protein
VDVDDAATAVVTAQQLLAAAANHNYWLLAALAVSLLMFLLKTGLTKAGKWDKLGRYKYLLPPALSIIATLLAAFQGGVSWPVALGVFTASSTTSSLQVIWDKVIQGNP